MSQVSRRYKAIAPILTVMIITLVLTFLAIMIDVASRASSGPFNTGPFFISNLLLVGIGLMLAIIVFYFVLRGSVTIGVRIAVSVFVFSAIMSLLLYVKLLLTMYGTQASALFVIISVIAYVASFLGILAIFDVLSRRKRNAFFAICSAVLGSFAGVLTPPFALVFVLLLLVVIDFVSTRRHTVERTKKVLDDYERLVIMSLSYAGRDWAIGLADLLSYSMLIANCLANFGVIPSLASLLLVLLGFFLGAWRTSEGGTVAGLPLAVSLGLVPIFVELILPVFA